MNTKFFTLFTILVLSTTSLFAKSLNIETIEPCAKTTNAIYNHDMLCINGEKIERNNKLATYGGNDVTYTTASGDYKSIVSKHTNGQIIWEVTTKDDTVYTYGDGSTTKHHATILYTGNGSTQTIETGIASVDFTQANNGSGYWLDRATFEVKTDAGTVVESGSVAVNLSKVHIKSRSAADHHKIFDGIRGYGQELYAHLTNKEGFGAITLTNFNSNGFSISTDTNLNKNGDEYVVYQTLYTHVNWGTTNHGKKYVEAYNPESKETMIIYQGSGQAGHEISHSLNTQLEFAVVKNLNISSDWVTYNHTKGGSEYLRLNGTYASTPTSITWNSTNATDKTLTLGTYEASNGSNNTLILYGKAKSTTWSIIEYTGTGSSGLFIETKDVNGKERMPKTLLVKSTSVSGTHWKLHDSLRGVDKGIYVSSSSAEDTTSSYGVSSFTDSGFTVYGSNDNYNQNGSKYLALVTFEPINNTNSYNKTFKLSSIAPASNSEVKLAFANSQIDYMYEKVNKDAFLRAISITNGTSTQNYVVNTIVNSDKTFTRTVIYDANGKVLRDEFNATGLEPQVTKYEYNTINSNSIVKTINGLGHITTNAYDTNNNLISSKDANGLETTYTYNIDNRLIKEVKANGVEINYEYSTTELIDGAALKVVQTQAKTPTLTIYYDENHRKIRTQKEAFNSRIVYEDIIYDDSGRISQYSIPYFKGETAYYVMLSYDENNRVVEINKPGVKEERLITSYVYNETTTDITYPDGKTKTINNDGTNTNITNSYDVLGNLVSSVDDMGRKIVFEYDVLNRLIKKEIIQNGQTDAENTSYFVYDRASNGVGKLAYEKSNEYKKEYYYDEKSRLKATKNYLGNKTFITQYTYTPEGKLEKTISPDGFVTINEYNELGYLSGIKSPKSDSVELSFEDIQKLITSNLADEYNLYSRYYDLKSKAKFYELKQAVYTSLSSQYASVDTEIEAHLTQVASLLGETVALLNHNISEYATYLDNYKKIRNSYLLPKATQNSAEENFKWLRDTFSQQSKNYVNLSTSYIDQASGLLEGIILNPTLLDSALNIDKSLIGYYQSQSSEVVTYADSFLTQSNLYSQRYDELKKGLGETQESSYLGMFDDNEYKYFYKILDTDPLGRVTHEIFGNGLVTKKAYDVSSGNLVRIIAGYYGNNDIKDIKYTFDSNNNLTAMHDIKRGYTQTYKYNASNRLISASNVGASFYSNIAYNYVTPDSSIYSYNSGTNSFTDSTAGLSVNVSDPSIISQNSITTQTLYSTDKKSYKQTKTVDGNISTTYKVNDNFKYSISDEEVSYKNFIFVNNKLIAIHNEEQIDDIVIPNNYYIHKDVFGSVDVITNQSAGVEKRVSYRPFGEKSDITWTQLDNENKITNYGYKGFERNEFNLLEINGYVYDPKVAKTLSDESINSLDEQSSEFFMNSTPTKHLDGTLDSWYKEFIGLFNMKKLFSNNDPLYNFEVQKNIYTLASLSNVYIGTTSPDDTSLIWYKPNASGGLDISIYDGTQWVSKGSTGSLDAAGTITADSTEQLNSMPCFYQDNGFVTEGVNQIPYTCSSEQTWELGGQFTGTFTVLDLVTKYKDATAGSKINVSAPNSEYAGTKEFTKVNTNWVDATNNYIASTNLANIMSVNINTQGYGYVAKDSNSFYSLQKLNIPSVGVKWTYLANGLDNVALDFNAIETNEGGYVYDKKNNLYVSQENSVWSTVDNSIQLTASNSGRDAFTNLNTSNTYYLVNNDCTEATCNGTVENNYYAGILFDNLYMFSHDTNGKNKNSLVDAIPQASMTDIYANGHNAVMYNNEVYLKTTDNKNRTTYKRSDGVYFTKSEVAIPSTFVENGILNLPLNVTSETVTFDGNAIILANYTEATNWTDAPNNTEAKIATETLTHIVNGAQDFWTDNITGDGQQSATIIFTKGDRGNLPTVTHSITALTKELGEQDRYTDSGVTSSVDATFKQWYYSVTGTSNLVDAKLCTSSLMCYAITDVPKIIHNDVLLSKVSNLWQHPNGTYLLKFMDNTYHADIVIVNNAIGKANNGLWYDSGNQATNWDAGKSLCEAKGMRLPSRTETQRYNGVPSYNGMTWTSTYHSTQSDIPIYYWWNGSSENINFRFYARNIRCVK